MNDSSTSKNTIYTSMFHTDHTDKVLKFMQKNISIPLLLEYYVQDIKQLENTKLILLSNERLNNIDSKDVITQEEFDKKFNITDHDLIGYEKIEFE